MIFILILIYLFSVFFLSNLVWDATFSHGRFKEYDVLSLVKAFFFMVTPVLNTIIVITILYFILCRESILRK